MSNLLQSQKEASGSDLTKKSSKSTPHLVNFSDEIGLRLKGVFEDVSQKKNKKASTLPFDPVKVEAEMLSKSLWTVFTGLPNVTSKLARERAARLQELLHFCVSPEVTIADVDRGLKQFVFETMNLTDVSKKNFIRKSSRNLTIPWDDPYPNIGATLSEEQQMFLQNLNKIEAKRGSEENNKKRNASSASSTTKSIKFQDELASESLNKDSSIPSSILKSRSSTKLSG